MRTARGLAPKRRRAVRLQDDDDEAQLLRGLVTFRQHAAGEGGVGSSAAKQFNTPARSFDVEFARQLQSLQLLNSTVVDVGGGGGGSCEDSPTLRTPPPGAVDVSADMLMMAAEGQLRRGLRLRRPVAANPDDRLALGSRLLLGHFHRRTSPLGEATATALEGPRKEQQQASLSSSCGGRLAYRKSRDGPGTQPDAEVERLLRSRSGTALVGWAGVGSGGAAPTTTASVSIVQGGHRGSAVKSSTTFSAATFTSSQLDGQLVASVDAAVAIVTPTPPPPHRVFAAAHAASVDEEQPANEEGRRGRRQAAAAATKRRKDHGRRRKVTGLDMLDGTIDAVPQMPPQPTPASPLPRRVAINSTKSGATNNGTSMSHSRVVAGSSDDRSYGHDCSVGRERTCSSRDLRLCRRQSMERSGGSWRAAASPAAATAESVPSERANSNSESLRLSLPSNQDDLTVPPAEAANSDAAVERLPRLRRLPEPDQYRVAHELARSANRNAQFAAWLRLGGAGREPGDFFVGRTSVTAAGYSYFPPLPRYDRGLRPWPDADDDDDDKQATATPRRQQYNGQMRTLFYGRKRHTPAYLAYGDKRPEDFLPPPTIGRRRQPGRMAKKLL